MKSYEELLTAFAELLNKHGFGLADPETSLESVMENGETFEDTEGFGTKFEFELPTDTQFRSVRRYTIYAYDSPEWSWDDDENDMDCTPVGYNWDF